MRARGLKPLGMPSSVTDAGVAPHAGAWIETLCLRRENIPVIVAPHAGAWIETRRPCCLEQVVSASRPMRARGLKHAHAVRILRLAKSRPMRARGLKLI